MGLVDLVLIIVDNIGLSALLFLGGLEMKRILYLSPNDKMLFSFAGQIEVVKMSGCEVIKSKDKADYLKYVDTSEFDLIVVLDEYQYLVNEIRNHGVGKTPVLYLDIFNETEPFTGATLLDCFLEFEEPIREIEKILGIPILYNPPSDE